MLSRVFGEGATSFELILEPAGLENDWFEVECARGRIAVSGSSAIALCRGAYHYVKSAGLGQVSWSGEKPSLPRALPPLSLTRVETPARHRHYLSVCTYGYTAAWWDWERWERELDWMALHGINMPLLLCGTEAVTRRVFLKAGLSEKDIAAHFSGPAYLCWHRLGNLNGYMGPLPESWITGQENLQQLILNRARELGMQPIVPGFSGFVPTAFQRLKPEVELRSAEPWAGFEPTYYLDPRDDEFLKLGRLYVEEYHRTYGPVHHYLCEIFAEQVPCLDPATELDELREIGRATWGALFTADPDANWVMQGWPFYFAREYWQPCKSAALLEAAPAGKVFVLDLATEELETWRCQPAMREKGWMFNVVHNYGQNTQLHGDLQGFISRSHAALTDPSKGCLQGMGISPEGIDQNPVVYELLTDLMWNEPTDLQGWVNGYARARYGKTGAEEAWQLIVKALYGTEMALHPRYTWRFRPGDQPLVASPDTEACREALEALLALSERLRGSSNYRRDIVDVAKTWLGSIADRFLEFALAGADATQFFAALADLDSLLASRTEHRLTTWIGAARALGSSPFESDHFERNARTLLTSWGGPFLFDYATREWAGLILDFHAQRWRRWFDHLAGGQAPDFSAWEQAWSTSKAPPIESVAGDEIDLAEYLLEKYKGVAFPPDRELTVKRLDPEAAHNGKVTVSLDRGKRLVAVACAPIFGQGMKARYHLEISGNGLDWEAIEPYGCGPETCRGTRALLSGQSVSNLRFSVDIIQGSVDQLYSVTLFEA